MSSEIIYKENRITSRDENIFVKSDKGRAVIRASPKPKFLSFPRFIFIIRSVFLPEGFPDSVHGDYIPYQIWDTVQAFASTILGILTTHSILIGVGVGESTATPLAATIAWILKDGAGMIGRILFAWWNGSRLDAQCKKWRILALRLDSLNEDRLAILLDNYTRHQSIVGVEECNKRESLLLFQKPFKQFCGCEIKMGVTLSPILQRKTTSLDYIIKLRSHFRNKRYMIVPDVENRRIYVGLNENVEPSDVLEAFFHSYRCGIEITSADCGKNEEINETISRIIDNKSSVDFKSWHKLLRASDWKQEINLLPVGEWRARWDL
ncbi:uncharacterized protein [Fopius arisanus]|uniref:Uncharacterized protein n=1 Tax=Fopius arisanus TaxID=64838 RepID=A0A9R1THE2_9HYME|nr:PREDICTED: uncharacterized protein LOC105270062 [Fopius arisanus]